MIFNHIILIEDFYMIRIANIQTKLIESIKQSGLTQTEIARRIGVSQSAVAHYVKGDIIPSLDTFASLCKVLDLDANEVLCINQTESERIKGTLLQTAKLCEIMENVKEQSTKNSEKA